MTAVVFGRASLRLVGGECGAGSPPRRAGNFLLRGQKKVTKEEALNRTPAPRARATPCNSRSLSGTTRPAALSRLSLSPEPFTAAPGRLTRGCTPCSRDMPKTAALGRRDGSLLCVGWGEHSEPQRRLHQPRWRRPSDAVFACPGEHGVQPRVRRLEAGAIVLVTRTAARAQRVASSLNASARFRAPLFAAPRSLAVQRLFFGDFLLAPQKKVTAPPGAHPGTSLASLKK